jgi:2-keto-4-pentenoate hydratase/2-oxohepta-3-ene-1,7-dioic acid hydratase in catechol pathway
MRLFSYRDPDQTAASDMVWTGVDGRSWSPGIRVGRLLPDGTVERGRAPGRLRPDGTHEESPDQSPVAASELTPAPAIPRPGKIVCIGLNYRDHVAEQGIDLPDRPLLFAKFANAVIADGEPIVRPAGTHALDLEAELGVVIGVRAQRVRAEDAMAHVMGYVVVNDVSARDWQGSKVALRDGERGDGQWLRAKGSDTFFPIGPVLALADEFDGPPDLAIRSWRIPGSGPDAGRPFLMQDSRTSNLVFGIPALIEFVSRSITLDPGDIISTGTPAGVGVFRDPPVYLEPGDRVRVEIEGIGSVENPVVDWSDVEDDGDVDVGLAPESE